MTEFGRGWGLRNNPVSTDYLRYTTFMRLPPNSIIAARKLTEYLLMYRVRNDKSL